MAIRRKVEPGGEWESLDGGHPGGVEALKHEALVAQRSLESLYSFERQHGDSISPKPAEDMWDHVEGLQLLGVLAAFVLSNLMFICFSFVEVNHYGTAKHPRESREGYWIAATCFMIGATIGNGFCTPRILYVLHSKVSFGHFPFINWGLILAWVIAISGQAIITGLFIFNGRTVVPNTEGCHALRLQGVAVFLVPLVIGSLLYWRREYAALFQGRKHPPSVLADPSIEYSLTTKLAAYIRIQPILLGTVSLGVSATLCFVDSYREAAGHDTFPKTLLLMTSTLGYLMMLFVMVNATDRCNMYRRQESYRSFALYSVFYWLSTILFFTLASAPRAPFGLACLSYLVLTILLPCYTWIIALGWARRRRALDDALAAAGATPFIVSKLPRAGYCSSCDDALATMALIPCGHFALCSRCTPEKCPRCDRRYDAKMTVLFD